MGRRLTGILLFSFLLFSGCSLFTPAPEPEPVFPYPGADPEMAAMLDGYRPGLERAMGRKIATIEDTLRFDKPESALGNLVADALRYRAANEIRRFVHIGIIGDSSFNLFFKPGDLTIGQLYDFFPYENHLVVLTLKGDKVQELLNQVAELGGAPVSGVRFNINDEGRARGVLVNAEVIDPERSYRVATTSWAANGGDVFPALWEASARQDLPLSVREIFADYFRGQSQLHDFTDGRIRR